MKELGSEVAGSSKDTQRIQPKPKTQLSRTVRPVKSEQPSGSLTQEIGKDILFGCESTNVSTSTRKLGCIFQDMEPPKFSSIFRKSSNVRKPIRCVLFTKAVVRHANIRDQNPSLGMSCPGDPYQRNPNAPKFEDRSQEETE